MKRNTKLVLVGSLLVISMVVCAGESTRIGPEAIPLPPGAVGRIGIGHWDVVVLQSKGASFEEALRYRAHSGQICSLAFAPDGKALASAGSDGTVCIWKTETGERLLKFEGHGNRVESVAFSADGKTLASGGWDRKVRLWDAVTGEQSRILDAHHIVYSVALSPNGKHVASCGFRAICIWDAATGDELHRLRGHGSDVTLSIAFSPDGETLASGSNDNRPGGRDNPVGIWDVTTGKELGKLEGHRAAVRCVAFSPDGETLASGGGDKTIILWDVATGKRLSAFEDQGRVNRLAFSPDGEILVSAGSDGTKLSNGITAWGPATGRRLGRLPGDGWYITALAFSPDGKLLASGGYDGTILFWDTAPLHTPGRK